MRRFFRAEAAILGLGRFSDAFLFAVSLIRAMAIFDVMGYLLMDVWKRRNNSIAVCTVEYRSETQQQSKSLSVNILRV
jgi:hypothetical protein